MAEEEALHNENISKGNEKKVTARTLCDMIGSKYYMHNEEIQINPDLEVRVYDEND